MFLVHFSTVFLAILYVVCFDAPCNAQTLKPLIVISFDGFRADYITENTPNFKYLKENFASAKYLEPIFPTRTFTNHHTMVTGLYAEDHEVIDNPMFDEAGVEMRVSYKQFHAKPEVVPVYIENEEYGGDENRHTGVSCWPGSVYEYQDRKPFRIVEFIKKEQIQSMKARVDEFIQWIIKDNVNLVMAYIEEPDRSGHYHGIESEQTQNAIRMVDEVLGYVLEKLKEFNLENEVNLIVLSDHGMRTVTINDIVYLENCFEDCKLNETGHLYKASHSGCNVTILPNPGKEKYVYDQLKETSEKTGQFSVYKSDEIPKEYHLGSATRLKGMLYVVAKSGLAIWNDIFKYLVNKNSPSGFIIGCHGYDNKDEFMRTIFLAKGPMFKTKTESSEPISMIEVYPLIRHLLNIRGDASEFQKNKKMNIMKQLLVDDPDIGNENEADMSNVKDKSNIEDKSNVENDPQSSI